jgi:hypothetical protein
MPEKRITISDLTSLLHEKFGFNEGDSFNLARFLIEPNDKKTIQFKDRKGSYSKVVVKVVFNMGSFRTFMPEDDKLVGDKIKSFFGDDNQKIVNFERILKKLGKEKTGKVTDMELKDSID